MHREDNSVLDAELSPEVVAYLRQREVLVAQRLQEEVRHCEDWNTSQDLLLRRLVEQQTRAEGNLIELRESMAGQGEYVDDILVTMTDPKHGKEQGRSIRSWREVSPEPEAEPPKAQAEKAGPIAQAPEHNNMESGARPEAELFRGSAPRERSCDGWCLAILRRDNSGTLIGRCVTSREFETLCGCVICLNAAFIGYAGNYAINNLENPRNTFIKVCEYLFFSFYGTELLLKLAVLRLNFFENADMLWNIFDLVLVLQATYDIVYEAATAGSDGGGDLTWMRLLRLLKMLKMLRMVRVMRAFRELRLMLRSVTGSITVLFWSMVMLFLVMYVFGLVFLQAATAYLSETPKQKLDKDTVSGIEEFWGDLGTSILTLYMVITGGYDWADIAEPLKKAGEIYYILFLLYVAALTFAILNILTGIFAEAAMKIRQRDHENVTHEEMTRDKSAENDIRRLFQKLDADHSGAIMWEEFKSHLNNREVRAFFNTLEIEASNAEDLFHLLGNGENKVTCDAFIHGCKRYKGAARSLDILALAHETRRFSSDMDLFMQFFEEKCYTLQRALTGSPAPLTVQPLEPRFAVAGCKQQKKEKVAPGAAALAAVAMLKADL
mmetsp:Transcript_10237/g.19450  ORF Transcript_10237/g.19450 Transcript_10237/m.19450 type:complete len:608 (-) Transcript_10237:91-1914(-)|eukprot:CAMPEP_0172773520 /NCGR_PEP_ID=MMETSP1074-20121228/194424_1 /TAXON_ID=2916 /ORGANISM="Ceratium fusus, Strain PA161109" /LENGTH=607 /DNA_ID=CAMNT_0013609807 /DNA_START=96 /DNA_END=1919 /DNA_ORIENTATION=-